VEYINGLTVENIIDYEQNIRYKQQFNLLFEQLRDLDNFYFLSELNNDTFKNISKFNKQFSYLFDTRNLKLLSFELFSNLNLHLTTYKLIKSKVFLIDGKYKKDYRFRNSIGVLSLFNSKYFVRIVNNNYEYSNKQLRYLYSKQIEDNPLLKSDMFFISLNREIEKTLNDLHFEFLLRENEKLFENSETLKEFLTQYNEKLILEENNSSSILYIPNLYVFEGYLDGLAFIELTYRLIHSKKLKLPLSYCNNKILNTISTGGVNNFRFVPLFLKKLLLYSSLFTSMKNKKIYNKLIIDKLFFIFDGDLDTYKVIEPITNYLDFVFSKLSDVKVNNISFIKFSPKLSNVNVKDVNEFLISVNIE
jgi:hypothetical protein